MKGIRQHNVRSTPLMASFVPTDDVDFTFYGWQNRKVPNPNNAVCACGRGKAPDSAAIAEGKQQGLLVLMRLVLQPGNCVGTDPKSESEFSDASIL